MVIQSYPGEVLLLLANKLEKTVSELSLEQLRNDAKKTYEEVKAKTYATVDYASKTFDTTKESVNAVIETAGKTYESAEKTAKDAIKTTTETYTHVKDTVNTTLEAVTDTASKTAKTLQETYDYTSETASEIAKKAQHGADTVVEFVTGRPIERAKEPEPVKKVVTPKTIVTEKKEKPIPAVIKSKDTEKAKVAKDAVKEPASVPVAVAAALVEEPVPASPVVIETAAVPEIKLEVVKDAPADTVKDVVIMAPVETKSETKATSKVETQASNAEFNPDLDFNAALASLPDANSISEILKNSLHSLAEKLNDLQSTLKDSDASVCVANVRDKLMGLSTYLQLLESEEVVKIGLILEQQSDIFSKMVSELRIEHEHQLATQASHLLDECTTQLLAQEEKAIEKIVEATEKLDKQAEEFRGVLQTELANQADQLNKDWNQKLKERVDEERSIRLARLDNLSLQLKFLEKVTLDASEGLARSNRIQMLMACVNSIKCAMDDARVHDISKELALIKRLGREDRFVASILDSLPLDIVDHKVTYRQLVAQYKDLQPAIREAQLVPEKAGLISYMLAKLASKLLITRRGLVAGKDVESVLARTTYYLDNNDVDKAARELNQIGGWSGLIAQGWLEKVRAYLEIQQAVEIIDNHLQMQSLGAVE
jgi:MICOS complex subunit MIC60